MSKNKIRVLFVTLLSVALLSACGTSAPSGTGTTSSSSSKNYNVIFGTPHPTTHHAHKNVYEPWKALVEEQTDGQVTVELHPGSVLGAVSTAFEDISSGVYDTALIVVSEYMDTDFFPYSILMLPFAFPDVAASNNIAQQVAEQLYQEEAFRDVYSLGFFTSDPYSLFSTKPVETLEDVQGLKIHVPNDSIAEVVKAWGATPVTMAPAEVYQALERKTVDATIYSTVGAAGFKFNEVAPFAIDVGFVSMANIMAMNRGKYEDFPEEIKAKFDGEISTFMSTAFRDSYLKEVDRVKEIYKQGHNGKGGLFTLSDEELKRFKAPAESVWNAWVEEANKKGYDGDQIMAQFKDILSKNNLQVPF